MQLVVIETHQNKIFSYLFPFNITKFLFCHNAVPFPASYRQNGKCCLLQHPNTFSDKITVRNLFI